MEDIALPIFRTIGYETIAALFFIQVLAVLLIGLFYFDSCEMFGRARKENQKRADEARAILNAIRDLRSNFNGRISRIERRRG